MWMLPVHGFARRRKAHIGRNETPLILVYAGGAVKTFVFTAPPFLLVEGLRFVIGVIIGRCRLQRNCPAAAFLDSLASTR